MARVRVLHPFKRQYHRAPLVSATLSAWLLANNDQTPEAVFPARLYTGIGAGHIFDLPAAMVDELVAAGLAERVDQSTPAQLPDGTLTLTSTGR